MDTPLDRQGFNAQFREALMLLLSNPSGKQLHHDTTELMLAMMAEGLPAFDMRPSYVIWAVSKNPLAFPAAQRVLDEQGITLPTAERRARMDAENLIPGDPIVKVTGKENTPLGYALAMKQAVVQLPSRFEDWRTNANPSSGFVPFREKDWPAAEHLTELCLATMLSS